MSWLLAFLCLWFIFSKLPDTQQGDQELDDEYNDFFKEEDRLECYEDSY